MGSFDIRFFVIILGYNKNTFWIGATNLGTEPNFYWMGYDKPVTFTDWLKGEPNNAGGHENCIVIWADVGYLWDDAPCGDRYYFICEEDSFEATIVE